MKNTFAQYNSKIRWKTR